MRRVRGTPIIAVTANATEDHRADYLAAGMDDLIAKPISIVSLLQTMDAVLAPARALCRQGATEIDTSPLAA